MASPEQNASRSEGKQNPAAPSIFLPKGGGAIRGMGEKFAANPVTGTGSMSVPIAISPGRSGFGPQLSLSYDSGAGNGPFGFGWSLGLPQITRKTDKGLPRYNDAEESDVFIISGAEDLVPVFDDTGKRVSDTTTAQGYTIHRYRPRIEGLFARIERWTCNADGDVHWRSLSKDNILTLYGKDSNSRIADPENLRHIFTWLICETRDDKGNAVLYDYQSEDGAGINPNWAHERNRGGCDDPRRRANRYLKHIRYGNREHMLDGHGHRPPFLTDEQIKNTGWMFEVVFDFDEAHYSEIALDEARTEAEQHRYTKASALAGQPWTVRPDPFSTYRAGFEVRTYRRCQRVLMFHHFPGEAEVDTDCLVRSTEFTYSDIEDETDPRNPVYTFLRKVTQSGYRREKVGYLKRSLPPLEFEYTQPQVQDTLQDVDSASLENLPMGVDGTTYQWTDLYGEGIPGILTEQADAWFYKRNLSPASSHPIEFGPMERVATKPNLSLAGGQAQFMDLAGDGQPDLVVMDGPMPGYYEHDLAEGWQSFRAFPSRLNREMRDPNLGFVDLNGDGHADVLITEDDAIVWHASLAEEGFGPAQRIRLAPDEEKGPRLVFADGTQSIYLADFSGDGLTDLARIRNGEVCYWPNLGHGRFGAKVTMDGTPQFDCPDLFDSKRIRLADIDGSGTTDLIYLHQDGVRLYFNQSGNGWSEPRSLKVFPRVDDLVNITVTDLLGNGTACLVWSSPLPGDARRPMSYVNLMGGQKPHLLFRTINNLGAETIVDYAPSTKFYLRDKREGRPWITRLPFPVQVVERVETFDQISRNHFVTSYAYRHGYFDGEEREFRGFGMVEQRDTEIFGFVEDKGLVEKAENVDKASHVPPVLTRTWFHTGSFLDGANISLQMAQEYYGAPDVGDPDHAKKWKAFEANLLPDTILPNSILLPDGTRSPHQLTAAEEREACRALKGSILRQEIFAEDHSPKAMHPYTASERNYTIELLQPRGPANRHGVFFVHPRETMDYHHERNPVDPRVSHALTLEVDRYGNALKSLAIGYGRTPGQSPLEGEDRKKQERLLITYTENAFTKAIDEPLDVPTYDPSNHRAPLPCEARTFELTGFEPEKQAARFSFDEWTRADGALVASAQELPYEQTADHVSKQKRVFELVRTLYRKDNLTALLPLGALEALALPGESYKLAFTPGLLAQVFQREEQRLLPDPASVLGG